MTKISPRWHQLIVGILQKLASTKCGGPQNLPQLHCRDPQIRPQPIVGILKITDLQLVRDPQNWPKPSVGVLKTRLNDSCRHKFEASFRTQCCKSWGIDFQQLFFLKFQQLTADGQCNLSNHDLFVQNLPSLSSPDSGGTEEVDSEVIWFGANVWPVMSIWWPAQDVCKLGFTIGCETPNRMLVFSSSNDTAPWFISSSLFSIFNHIVQAIKRTLMYHCIPVHHSHPPTPPPTATPPRALGFGQKNTSSSPTHPSVQARLTQSPKFFGIWIVPSTYISQLHYRNTCAKKKYSNLKN